MHSTTKSTAKVMHRSVKLNSKPDIIMLTLNGDNLLSNFHLHTNLPSHRISQYSRMSKQSQQTQQTQKRDWSHLKGGSLLRHLAATTTNFASRNGYNAFTNSSIRLLDRKGTSFSQVQSPRPQSNEQKQFLLPKKLKKANKSINLTAQNNSTTSQKDDVALRVQRIAQLVNCTLQDSMDSKLSRYD